MLVQVAQRLAKCARAADTVARLGGDEFLFLLFGVTKVGAARAAENILRQLAKPSQADGREVTVTGSVGIALYPDDQEDIEPLIRSADEARYRAKQRGGSAFQFAREAGGAFGQGN